MALSVCEPRGSLSSACPVAAGLTRRLRAGCLASQDLHGVLQIPNALSKELVDDLNALLDEHIATDTDDDWRTLRFPVSDGRPGAQTEAPPNGVEVNRLPTLPSPLRLGAACGLRTAAVCYSVLCAAQLKET